MAFSHRTLPSFGLALSRLPPPMLEHAIKGQTASLAPVDFMKTIDCRSESWGYGIWDGSDMSHEDKEETCTLFDDIVVGLPSDIVVQDHRIECRLLTLDLTMLWKMLLRTLRGERRRLGTRE